ncbi:MAG: TonB family protein [Acidobacteriota bacterium]
MQNSRLLGRGIFLVMTLGMGLPALSAPGSSAPILISSTGSVEVRSIASRSLFPSRGTVVLPEYPPAARRGRMDGRVRLTATIDPTGRVTDLFCLDCQKDRAGFIASAMEAVGQWVYQPAQSPDGDPISISILFDIRFTPVPGNFARPVRRTLVPPQEGALR